MSALNPSDLAEDACQGVGDDLFGPSQGYLSIPDPLELLGNDSVSMVSQDAFENNKLASRTGVEKSDSTNMTVDNFSALNSEVNSPRETVSPTASSPFSAMESDGEGIETGQDDANLSCAGDQSFNPNNGYFGASTPLHTTTPCASSSCCDDEYESIGSRKKRRKTRRDMHHVHPGLSVVPVMKQPNNEWPHDETSPFSPPTCPKAMSFQFGSKNIKTLSNTQVEDDDEFPPGNAKRTRKCTEPGDEEMNVANIKTEAPSNMDTAMALAQTTPVTKRGANLSSHTTVTTDDEQVLHRQYPRKSGSYELHIVTQPEPQHRARYLTEGSRGPVKDATQTGFPKVQLLGYTKPVILQVFVATDSGKAKPHGFYQACRVTGRNTSPCEEIEIQGTKVIEIPFKQEDGCMVLNIDCVGILKLRNTDVEVRTGLRNQKRNQSVRLVFRVALKATSSNGAQIVLQVASSRISCTQPLGQPEITKKSIDRCSVEGGTEMFIIGKNFHRGTKVIYQDPEEPDGKQWTAEGEIEKDTFHQYHMVVRVPPYHDQNIVKPVNVQLIVEFQDKKCEPHSFTYTPKPKEPEPAKEETKQPAQTVAGTNIESAFNRIDGSLDKKLLLQLFSRLLYDGDSSSGNNTPLKGDMASINSANSNSAINSQSLLSAVLQNHTGGAPVQTVSKTVSAGNSDPVSPPSTLFAAITVQNQLPVFAKSITNNAPLQSQVIEAYVRTNAAGNVSSTITNNIAPVINPPRLIKSETIAPEAHPSFSGTTTVPSLEMCQSQPTPLAVGNSTAAVPVASHSMVVSPVTGQTFQTGIQQAVGYNSFTTSHSAVGSLISSAPGLAVSAVHQPALSQLNSAQMESSINSQVGEVHINDGFPQSTGAMTTVGGNAPSAFPVANFQLGQLQQQQQQQSMLLSNATSMVVPGLVATHSTSVAQAEHVQFSQGSNSINLQNNQGVVRSNVLQQPTFTFHQNPNIITTAAAHNPQITTTTISSAQTVGASSAFGNRNMQFTVGADVQTIQQQPVSVEQPVVIAKSQQPLAAILANSGHSTTAIAIAAKDVQNLPTTFSNSMNANQPFIVQSQNPSGFHQRQQLNTAQAQPSNSLPNVFQVSNVFPPQFSQLQLDKNQGSNQAQIQPLPPGSHSEEKPMQVDSFQPSQNQVCHTTISPINAIPVQTTVQPMNDVLTQNFNNSQVSTVIAEVPAGSQPPYNAIIISGHIPMTAEPSPPSNAETSPPTVTDSNQQIGYNMNSGISSHTYQAPQATETPMLHEPTANQPMELSQSNMTPTQADPNFHLQQQQPPQNTNTAIGHDGAMTQQNYHVNPTINIHNQTSFSGMQQQVIPGQTFQATNIGSAVSSGDVEMATPNGGLQQSILSTNNVTSFQGTSLVSDASSANFNSQNFQTMQKPTQITDMGQTFQSTGNTLGNVHNTGNLDNFQPNLQQQSPSVIGNEDNSGNVESHGFQAIQQSQNIGIPATQNFQTTSINYNATTAVLDQQNLQPNQQATATAQSMMIVDNFQSQNLGIAPPQAENVVATTVTFHNVMSDQQFQAPNQSTQSTQSVNSTGNTPSQDFAETSPKAHAINNHPQVNAWHNGNPGISLPRGSHSDLQPALHPLGQLQPPHPCATNNVNRPLEPHSPDIYAMHEVLKSINGEEELAAISREDVQRHCQ